MTGMEKLSTSLDLLNKTTHTPYGYLWYYKNPRNPLQSVCSRSLTG